MAIEGIEIAFETHMPVVGQINILTAIDHLYSLMALKEAGWAEDVDKMHDWQRYLASIPGKLLRSQHVLTVEYAGTGSVKEVLRGIPEALEKLLEFIFMYRQKIEKNKIQDAKMKALIVYQQLLPIIDEFKKRGIPEQIINSMLAKAMLLVDETITALLNENKLQLNSVASVAQPGRPCPMCKGIGSIP